MVIKIGPAGIGDRKHAPEILEEYNKQGITAAEIPFTYQVWLNKEQATELGKIAKKNKVSLSIHGSYYINLNSKEKAKIEASKKRILKCCEIGHYLGAKCIVFHAGFYQDIGEEKTYENIKVQIKELLAEIKKNKWDVVLCPETTGKASQFGTLDELLKLKKETGCSICVDFAHLKARYVGKIDYPEIMKKLKSQGHIHSHFSGIEYTSKGERRHLVTETKDIKELLSHIQKNKISCTIINESPNTVGDSIKTIKILK